MAKRNEYRTRDPQPANRDPAPAQRKPRHYIPASMPTVCPVCGHATRMDDGRHTDPVRRTILEYRTCANCGKLLAAGRPMTPVEAERLCSRAEAVAEYEQSVR
jgi:anaerobic selenocysteine-containing dehydrogenase